MRLIREFHFESWDDFKCLFSERLVPGEILIRKQFLFRGQGDADWPLETSFGRKFGSKEECVHEHLLINFKEECESIKEYKDILEEKNKHELASLGQHYGLTSQLLDWSESPYIAAFFAYHNALSGLAKNDLKEIKADQGSVVVWALSLEEKENPFWIIQDNNMSEDEQGGVEDKQKIIVKRASLQHNKRLYNQMGWFTVQENIDKPLEIYIEETFGKSENKKAAFLKFIIPLRDVVTAMADLDLMSINAVRMYGADEGRARGALDKTIIDYLVGLIQREKKSEQISP